MMPTYARIYFTNSVPIYPKPPVIMIFFFILIIYLLILNFIITQLYMNIYDCFMYFDEDLLLDLRLKFFR